MSALVNESPNTLTTELWYIAGTGDLKRLDQLLNQGVDLNTGDRTGVTALMRAAYRGQLPMVRALLEHGADPNASDHGGLTALSMARHAGHHEIVEVLLSCGAIEKGDRPEPGLVNIANQGISATAKVAPAATPKISKAKTLHDPPEIWQLVHTTSTEFDSVPARGRFNFSRAIVFGAVVIIFTAAGLLGFRYLRGLRNNQSAEQRNEIANQPTVAQTPIADQREPNETTPINPPSQNSATAEPATQGVQTDAAAATTIGTSPRKPFPKTNKVTKTSTPFFPEKTANNLPNNLLNEKAGSTAKPTRPGNAPVTKPVEVRKEPAKSPIPPAADPTKPNVTKPKVIPWP